MAKRKKINYENLTTKNSYLDYDILKTNYKKSVLLYKNNLIKPEYINKGESINNQSSVMTKRLLNNVLGSLNNNNLSNVNAKSSRSLLIKKFVTQSKATTTVENPLLTYNKVLNDRFATERVVRNVYLNCLSNGHVFKNKKTWIESDPHPITLNHFVKS